MASRSLNKAMLIGNVGREPRLKFTPGGIPVVTFRLATTESWKERNGSLREHTDWHTIVAWRSLAQTIDKIIQKGDKVFVEGKIQTRVFDDKTGIRKTVVEILADNVILIGKSKNRVNNENNENYENNNEGNNDGNNENYNEENNDGVSSGGNNDDDIITNDLDFEMDYNLDEYINDYSTDNDEKPSVGF